MSEECDHVIGAAQGATGVYLVVDGGTHPDIRFRCCPYCGEKLTKEDKDVAWLRARATWAQPDDVAERYCEIADRLEGK